MPDHFYGMPTRRDIGNSVFKPHPARVLTTFNAGSLVPLWSREMLPGESLEIDPSFVLRSQTPLRPVFDDAFFDMYAFYIPNRLVLDSWEEVMGANKTSYWVDNTEHVVPTTTVKVLPGSVADYFGLPVSSRSETVTVNALRFRMYSMIFNEWFRDQNTMSLAACPTNSSSTVFTEDQLGDPFLESYKGGALLPVCRLPDYFSVCTPGPLKATNVVTLNLPDAPIVSAIRYGEEGGVYQDAGSIPLQLLFANINSMEQMPDEQVVVNPPAGGSVLGFPSGESVAAAVSTGSNIVPQQYVGTALMAQTSLAGISINDFRFAVQLQKLLERDLFGTRYTEILQSHFNVKTQDARLQRPELFGWSRYRLNQQQVAQTSGTQFNSEGDPTTTPLGDVAAYSLTASAGQRWRIASPEHGYVIILGTIRVKHSYQQGIERSWTRFGRYDFAWPEFVGLGNQPVYTRELYSQAPAGQVFGYQEYAADYRYNRKICTGEMRSSLSNTLDSWHYADYYDETPTLGSVWMADNSKILIDRTLAVSSELADQFFGAFDFATTLTTWLPTYSIPGYVDHF